MNSKILKKLLKFRDEREWEEFHTPENLAKSISIEAAELLECFQWDSDFEKKEVAEELADVFIYAIFLADEMGLDIEDIVLKKLAENIKRYPVEKAKGKSTKAEKL